MKYDVYADDTKVATVDLDIEAGAELRLKPVQTKFRYGAHVWYNRAGTVATPARVIGREGDEYVIAYFTGEEIFVSKTNPNHLKAKGNINMMRDYNIGPFE